MDSSFAPSIANLFMAHLEDNFILNSDVNPFFDSIFLFYRYMDDCFCIFRDPDSVGKFLDWLNNIHETISFTMEGDSHAVNFLDTTVFRNSDDVLCVKPYVKPTDCNTYLHYRSFHTKQLKNNIPYSQFLRLKRNVTNHEDFNLNADRLRKQFILRGYPSDIVLDAEARAHVQERKSLFKRPRSEVLNKRLHWAIHHSPRSLSISKIIKKYWSLVSDIPGCELPPQIGFRRTRSLRSILVHSAVSLKLKIAADPVGHHRCGHCKICPLTTSVKVIDFVDKGFSHTLTIFSNCKTCFAVYPLTCVCGKRYIGSTVHQLRVCILEHISRIS